MPTNPAQPGVFELFSIGIGPSSSHTVGPMRAARTFVERLSARDELDRVTRVEVHLFGSLGLTARGHGTMEGVVLGLLGERPESVDPVAARNLAAEAVTRGTLTLAGAVPVGFDIERDIVLHRRERLPFHSNGMRFEAWDRTGQLLDRREYFSVGGGFVVDEEEARDRVRAGPDSAFEVSGGVPIPHPFGSADELLAIAGTSGMRISDIALRNELSVRSEREVRQGILHIWSVMEQCITAGTRATGVLPGGLGVRRRAAAHRARLEATDSADDPLRAMEWVTLAALAVNEENAAGGRVVTAPTNGAAGIIPAVLSYYTRFVPGADDDGIVRFLLTGAAVGSVIKRNASISGAELGCQGEVGSACAMAAAGLAEVLGGTPEQVENAAEIGIEHNLGLTCDPVAGLVQIPCIERNAIAAITAITAARMAVRGDGEHSVSLDTVIATMRATGLDMSDKYKETALGGLALTVAAVDC